MFFSELFVNFRDLLRLISGINEVHHISFLCHHEISFSFIINYVNLSISFSNLSLNYRVIYQNSWRVSSFYLHTQHKYSSFTFISALIKILTPYLWVLTITILYLSIYFTFISSDQLISSNIWLRFISFISYFFDWGQLGFSDVLIIFYVVFITIKNLTIHCCLKLFLTVIKDQQFFVCILLQFLPFNHQIVISVFSFRLMLAQLTFFIEIEAQLHDLFS